MRQYDKCWYCTNQGKKAHKSVRFFRSNHNDSYYGSCEKHSKIHESESRSFRDEVTRGDCIMAEVLET